MQNNYVWHTDKPDLNSAATIHQILAYGNLEAISGLKKRLGEAQLKDLFLKKPQKVYTPSALNFIIKFILHISEPVDENRYLKTAPRYIGS